MTAPWEGGVSRRQQEAEDAAALRRTICALQDELARVKRRNEELGRFVAKLRKDNEDGHRALERLQAALAGVGG